MKYIYRRIYVVANDGSSILLTRIESINIFRNEKDVIIDKLKDDISFSVVTMSGKEYTISLNYFREKIEKETDLSSCDNNELLMAIYLAWERIHSKGNI